MLPYEPNDRLCLRFRSEKLVAYRIASVPSSSERMSSSYTCNARPGALFAHFKSRPFALKVAVLPGYVSHLSCVQYALNAHLVNGILLFFNQSLAGVVGRPAKVNRSDRKVPRHTHSATSVSPRCRRVTGLLMFVKSVATVYSVAPDAS